MSDDNEIFQPSPKTNKYFNSKLPITQLVIIQQSHSLTLFFGASELWLLGAIVSLGDWFIDWHISLIGIFQVNPVSLMPP